MRQIEADPAVRGWIRRVSDATGRVALDASIMEGTGRCGSVAFLEGFLHPILVARRVTEATSHVFLVGEGARAFALAEGFKEVNLLTREARTQRGVWLALVLPVGPRCWSPPHRRIHAAGRRSRGRLSEGCGALYRTKNAADALQVGFLALRRDGAIGAYSLQPGFTYAVKDARGVRLLQAPSLLG